MKWTRGSAASRRSSRADGGRSSASTATCASRTTSGRTRRTRPRGSTTATRGASASFYLQLEPGGESFAGGGLWTPEREDLGLVREAIADDPKAFARLLDAKAFRAAAPAGLDRDEGTVLARVPRPYPADHPAAEWLRLKSFTATVPFADDEVLGPGFADRLEGAYRALLPLARWLNGVLGHATSGRR